MGAEGPAAGGLQGRRGANGKESGFCMTQMEKGWEFKQGDAVARTRAQREHLDTETRWLSTYRSQGTGTEQD